MKAKALTAAVFIGMFLSGFGFSDPSKQGQNAESPEHLFNTATEAMIKGNSTEAIDLYYRLVQNYPEFKEYRADALYRLGMLLFKAERFVESEKILGMMAGKYKNYPQIKAVYEKLLYIYSRELSDGNRANKIRQLYEKRFGKGQVLENADKTERILNAAGAGGSGIMKLDPPDIGVVNVEESASYDDEFFPVQCVVKNISSSPDMKLAVERKKKNRKYFLYISDAAKMNNRLSGTKNGFAPQWSWDNKYVSFTAMDWGRKERNVKLYDVVKNRVKILFTAPTVGPLTCISPNGMLVAFWYQDGLWLANKAGSSVSLITKKVSGKGVTMMAWSREGDKLLVGKKVNGREMYYICTLGRKEFIIVK